MCYSITPAGLQLSRERDSAAHEISVGEGPRQSDPSIPDARSSHTGDQRLRQARHDVCVAGWALAVERSLEDGLLVLQGPGESVISPPSRSRSGDRLTHSVSDLSLPGGRTPHDFLRTVESGVRVEVERFQSIRPDATIGSGGRPDLLIELDDRLPEGLGAAKLERYDHFLAGWSTHLKHYARAGIELPIAVFVCRDRTRARECARRADRVLTACRAYAGEHPHDWHYPGRERIVFAAERDAHEGLLCAWGVPQLPPDVRVAAASADPRGRDPLVQQRDIYAGIKGPSLAE